MGLSALHRIWAVLMWNKVLISAYKGPRLPLPNLRFMGLHVMASPDTFHIDGLTVPQLKSELKKRGLPVTGLKKELQRRVLNADNDEEEKKEPRKVKAVDPDKTDKENFMDGTGRWTPLNSKAAHFSSEDDEEEDPYGDPFFTSELPNPNEWGGNAPPSQGEWSDWSEEANYFVEEEEDPDYSGYSADKSRGKTLGSVKKGSSSLFPSRAEYASMSEAREMAPPSSMVPAPGSLLNSPVEIVGIIGGADDSTGIELGSGRVLEPLEVQVIPPDMLKTLLDLEERVSLLSSDMNELKIVNAVLLLALFVTVYSLTRPIW